MWMREDDSSYTLRDVGKIPFQSTRSLIGANINEDSECFFPDTYREFMTRSTQVMLLPFSVFLFTMLVSDSPVRSNAIAVDM